METVLRVLVAVLFLVGFVRSFSDHDLHEALKRVRIKTQARRLSTLLDQLQKGDATKRSTASSCPLAQFHGPRPDFQKSQDEAAIDLLAAARLLLDDNILTTRDLRSRDVTNVFRRFAADFCPSQITCARTRYRSVNGTCNNLHFPWWGAAGTAQTRIMEPEYNDFIGEARQVDGNGRPLPNPRTISNVVHAAGPGPEVHSAKLTLHAFQMGQFLDHDLVKTPAIEDSIDCCETEDPARCASIRVEPGDSVFAQGYCMPVHRSSPFVCPQGNNFNVQRQQINDITSFVDASNVYGSSEVQMAELRDGTSPYLKTVLSPDGVHHRLPDNPDQTKCTSSPKAPCNMAGDERVNVIPSLTSYHTLFVLEHNRIVGQLSPYISDADVLFQEARKLLIAQMQKIVYDEFLPSFLSQQTLKEYQLPTNELYTYDPFIDPSITNEFGITYRFGHTWIPREMTLFTRNLSRVFPKDIRNEFQLPTENTFNRPKMTYAEMPVPDGGTNKLWGVEGLLYWLSGEKSPETDSIIEDAVRNRLFINRSSHESFDLAALNIQRGRDHGLAPFNSYRVLCQLKPLTNFGSQAVREAFGNMEPLLEKAGYRSPLDIDLFTGIVAERAPGGEPGLGPTGQCILGRQFHQLKFGDRFWFQGRDAGFSHDQQQEIRKSSMASILCQCANFESVNYPNAFNARDPVVPCSQVPKMDMAKFGTVDAGTLPYSGDPFSGSDGYPYSGSDGYPYSGSGGYPYSGSGGYPYSGSDGYPYSGSDGYPYSGSDGYPYSGSDGYPNSGSDGYPYSGSGGYPYSGSDGYPYSGSDGYPYSGSDGYPYSGSDGYPNSGSDGYSYSGSSGNPYSGSDGYPYSGSGGNPYSGSDGYPYSGSDGYPYSGSNGYPYSGSDGYPYSGSNNYPYSGSNGYPYSGSGGYPYSGSDGYPYSRSDGYPYSGSGGYPYSGSDGYPYSGSDDYPYSGSDGYPYSGSDGYPYSGSGGYPYSGSGGYPYSGSDDYPYSGSDGYPYSGSDGYPYSGSDGYPYSGSDGYPNSGSDGYPNSGSGGNPYSGSDGYPYSGSGGYPYSGSDGYPNSGSGGYPYSGSDGYPYSGSGGNIYSGSDGYPYSGSDGYPYSGSDGYPYSGSGGYPYSGSGVYPYSASGGYPYSRSGGNIYSGSGGYPYSGSDGYPYSGSDGYPYSESGGYPYSGSDGYPYSGSGSYPYSGSNGDPYSGSGGYPYSGSGGNLYSGSGGYPYSGSGGNPYSGSDGDPYSGSDGYPYSGSDGYPYSGSDGNLYSGSDVNLYSGSDGNLYSGSDGNLYSGSDGYLYSGSDGDPYSGSDGDPYSGSDGYPYSGSDGYPYSGSNGDPYSGSGGYPYSGSDGYPYSGSNGYPYSGSDGYPYSGSGSYPYSGSGSYPYSGSDGYPYSGSGGYPYSGSDGYPYSGSDGYPYSGSGGYPYSGSGGYPYSGSDGYPNSESGGYPYSGSGGYPYSGSGGYPYSGSGGYPYSGSGGYPYSGSGGYPYSGSGGYPYSESGGYPYSGSGGYLYSGSGGYHYSGSGGYPYSGSGGYPYSGSDSFHYSGSIGYLRRRKNKIQSILENDRSVSYAHPVSCRDLGERVNGVYTLYNKQNQGYTVYCRFEAGYGYTYIAPTNAAEPSLSDIYKDGSHVLIRTRNLDGTQKEVRIEQISSYSNYSLSVQYTEHKGYNPIVNKQMAPFLYVGLLPIKGLAHRRAVEGYKANNVEHKFINCDGNPNSYFAFLYNNEDKPPRQYLGPNLFISAWIDAAQPVSTKIPPSFFTFFEVHMGGCGGFISGNHYPNLSGAVLGLRFEL